MNHANRTGIAPGGHWGLFYLLGIPFRTKTSKSRMDVMRDRRLKWLVSHAARTIPFYRELLEQSGVDPGSVIGFGGSL